MKKSTLGFHALCFSLSSLSTCSPLQYQSHTDSRSTSVPFFPVILVLPPIPNKIFVSLSFLLPCSFPLRFHSTCFKIGKEKLLRMAVFRLKVKLCKMGAQVSFISLAYLIPQSEKCTCYSNHNSLVSSFLVGMKFLLFPSKIANISRVLFHPIYWIMEYP